MSKGKYRKCYKCQQHKWLYDFPNNKSKPEGKDYQCKECCKKQSKEYHKNNKEARKESGKEYRYKNADVIKIRRKEKLYGISESEQEELITLCNNKCEICGIDAKFSTKQVLNIDHDHSTGDIRGMLCGKCNKGLGLLGDNLESLKKVVNYLEREVIYESRADVSSNDNK